MTISWRDGITMLSAAGAVTLERAHFHWDWPLITSVRWAVVAIGIMALIGLIAGFVFDENKNSIWTAITLGFSVVAVALVTGGLITASADYAVLTMLAVVAIWLTSVFKHLFESHQSGRYTATTT